MQTNNYNTKIPNYNKTTPNRGKRQLPSRWPGPIYWVMLFSTVILLIGLTISLFVVLAIDGGNDPSIEYDGGASGGNSGANGGKKPSSSGSGEVKTGISLPSSTAVGSYLSSSASNVAAIEGITSECGILVDANGNVSVAEKSADTVIHPASMTKVMTLLVACERAKDPTALLTVTQDMLDRRLELDGSGELVDNTSVVDADGNSKKIEIVGKSVTVEDALYLINYKSDTAACLMIANHIAGSEAAFVDLMNQKARAIGLTSTNFVNCTGLTEKDGSHNTTTCREMASIMECALNNVVAKKIISSTQKYKANIYDNGKKTEYYVPFFADWYNKEARLNGNTKAGSVTIKGGKTGYENIPTSCFVTYGTNTSGTYICVVVGKTIGSTAKDVYNAVSTADTRLIYQKYAK